MANYNNNTRIMVIANSMMADATLQRMLQTFNHTICIL